MGPGPVPESLPKHKSGSIVSFIWASGPLETFQITVLSPQNNCSEKHSAVAEADERANSSAFARLYSAMDSRHASLGRRTVEISSPATCFFFSNLYPNTRIFLQFVHLIWNFQLEDIRQKRAAEKLSKTSSGPDLSKASIPIGSSSIFC